MATATDMAERHTRILARLSELGLAMAERLQERALAAEEPKAAADLGLAFHRISRSVRQTLALEAKLVRDAGREAREAERAEQERRRNPGPADVARAKRRRSDLMDAIEPLIWKEHEREEAEFLLECLSEELAMESLSSDFADAPLDQHIARLCRSLDLSAPQAEPTPAAPDSG